MASRQTAGGLNAGSSSSSNPLGTPLTRTPQLHCPPMSPMMQTPTPPMHLSRLPETPDADWQTQRWREWSITKKWNARSAAELKMSLATPFTGAAPANPMYTCNVVGLHPVMCQPEVQPSLT
eukprot:TRINITY_DN1675_c0_g1_i6.p2 TRINITY_DN1675_c0_g1~~TRINITY_DN1675_c0_g1_i6.p2  ORF type:complete len:122 (-),score=17.63 TRINITY_DN1675_c0_g1_i6:214-579(-)